MPIKENKCREFLDSASLDMDNLYKEDLLIYKGVTSDSHKLYNEVAAAYLYQNIAKFKEIEVYSRKQRYITDKYKKFDINQSNYNTEKQLTLKFYKQREFAVGKIIDCQMPLADKPRPNKLEKIDLILETPAKELIILKVKLANTEQSLLRYIVELITIYQRLDQQKLLYELNKMDYKVRFAPLLFKDSAPYKELLEDRIWLYRFLSLFDADIFVIENKRYPYKIVRKHYLHFASENIKSQLL